jgi:hypothetical protein
VIIVGGTAVISAAMETAIEALLPNAVVSRIAGADRYATNAMFSAATFPIEGWASIPAAAFTANEPDTDAVDQWRRLHHRRRAVCAIRCRSAGSQTRERPGTTAEPASTSAIE